MNSGLFLSSCNGSIIANHARIEEKPCCFCITARHMEMQYNFDWRNTDAILLPLTTSRIQSCDAGISAIKMRCGKRQVKRALGFIDENLCATLTPQYKNLLYKNRPHIDLPSLEIQVVDVQLQVPPNVGNRKLKKCNQSVKEVCKTCSYAENSVCLIARDYSRRDIYRIDQLLAMKLMSQILEELNSSIIENCWKHMELVSRLI